MLQLGRLATGPRPPHAQSDSARIQHDVHDWYCFLRDKYAPCYRLPNASGMGYSTARASLRAQTHGEVCAHAVTRQEVRNAIAQLQGGSAAIGIPTAVLKLLSSHEVVRVIQAAVQRMFDTGNVPSSYCVVRAVALHKKGDRSDKNNWRTIGVGMASSRLVQLIALNRLLQHSRTEMAVSANQHGFIFGRSTEQCIFTAMAATACATATGSSVHTVFLDLIGAFPSTPHDVILCRLRELGVPPYLWRFVDSWLQQQHMFVQIGRHASPLFPVNIGVVEGGPASPLQFILVLNSLPRKLDIMAGVPGCGLPAGPGRLVHKWFADDGALFGTSAASVQPLLDVCDSEADALGMAFNVGPAKTAAIRLLPTGKSQRARAKKQLQSQPDSLQLGQQDVPYVDAYKYLGIWMSSGGYTASVRLHVSKLMPVLAQILRQASTAGLRSLTILHSLSVYNTYWKPRVTYGMGLYAATVHSDIQRMEERVLKLMFDAPNVPLCVLRSIVGMPSFHAVLQLQQLGVLFRVLQAPPDDPMRAVLAQMARICQQQHAPSLWWSRVFDTLKDMDRVVPVCVDAAGVPGGQLLWSATLLREALHPASSDDTTIQVAGKHYRRVLLALEAERRSLEIGRCATSLADVRELLDTPNYAPFIVDRRSNVTDLRVKLRGGVRTLFGHQHRHINVCPWCDAGDGFSVPHLLRDCPHFEAERLQAWHGALQFGLRSSVLQDVNVAQHRQEWYLLMVGAAVPRTFCKIGLDADTHWARKEGTSTTGHLRRHCGVYQQLLRVTGAFLQSAVRQTATRLEEVSSRLSRREPAGAKRTVALRWSAQQLKKLRSSQAAQE